MADRRLVYRVELNASQAKAEAKTFASQIKAELSNIKISALDGKIFSTAEARIAKLRTELQSLGQVQPPKIAIDSTGIQQAAQQADNLERQLREAEQAARRTSAATRNVSAPRPNALAAGGGAGLGSLATGALGAVGISVSAAAILQGAVALDDLRAKAIRADAALVGLTGSGQKAESILKAIESASKGTVTELQAQEIAVQGLALNLAKTPAEFEKLVRAAKQITIGSAAIKDIGTALTELSLFAANEESFARADQLAVSASEVKDRMAELQAQDDSLTDSQAKLLATMGALEAKFGSVTDSAAASASGIERLRVAFADLFTELATGPVGTGVDAVFGAIADGVNNLNRSTQVTAANWKVVLGVDDLQDNVTRIEALLTEANLATGLERMQRGLFGDAVDAPALGQFLNTVKLFNQAIDEGASDVEAYRQVLDAIADDAADGSLTAGNVEALRNLDTVLVQEIQRLREFKAAQGGAAGPTPEEIADAQQALNDAVGKKAVDVAGAIGFDRAREVVKQELEKVKDLIAQFEQQGLTGLELDIAVSLAAEGIDADIQAIVDNSTAQMERLFAGGISSTIGRTIGELNSGIVDASPALTDVRDRLIELNAEIALSGQATQEQAQEYQNLMLVADAVGSSTGVFAALQGEAGQTLLTNNSYASSLATNIAMLDAAQANGTISAGQHAGALYSLVTALIAAAEQAGVTGAALAQLKAIQAGIDTTQPGFIRGQTFGNATVATQKAQEDARLRAEARQAAEKAAREQEAAAKRAARELEQGAKRAARELEGALQNVEGLFGTSKVTQKDLDFAATGGQVNFADDFVRHFRDLVENGTPWEDATPEKVKQALQNVGINPVDDLKGLMIQLEDAWNNSSLFANKDNLSLINADAVQQGLDLQEKMKQGRQNIMEAFGVAIDDATGAVSAGSADTTADEGLKTAVTDGKQKIIGHLTGATTAAVDAATASVVTGAGGGTTGTGTAQISALTIAPGTLEGLFATLKSPPLVIDSVEVGPNLIQSAVTAITTQVQGKANDLLSLGKALSVIIETGFTQYWVEAQASTTLAGGLRTAFGTQVQASRDSFVLQGRALAGLIDSGFSAYWEDAKSQTGIANAILAASATQLTNAATTIKAQGDGIASLIMIGFEAKFALAQEEAGMATAFRTAFGTQVQASRDAFTGQGNALAGIIEQGFIGHWSTAGTGGGEAGGGSQMATAVLDQLTSQLVSSADRMDAIGNGIAGLVMLGMDFAGAGGTLITQIESDLNTDVAIERLQGVGHDVADSLFNGFSAQVAQADWVGAIVAAVIAQLNAGVQASG